ncbi:MAG TPA: hypothetical protein VGJ92_08055 [Methanocella sp.]|jgi:hypothetical protein
MITAARLYHVPEITESSQKIVNGFHRIAADHFVDLRVIDRRVIAPELPVPVHGHGLTIPVIV